MIPLEIKAVADQAPSVTTLFFDKEIGTIPGQFGMFWLPDVGQRPMSFSRSDAITVRVVGPFSRALASLEPGDVVSMEGPYGNGFTLSGGRVLLIGGGFGIAPLRFLAQRCHEMGARVTTMLGFRCQDDLFFEDEMSSYGDVWVATEDGSCGYAGLVSCLFDEIGYEFDQAYCCGPEPMMKAVLDHYRERVPLQLLLERYMKCGMGLCGSCEMDGLLVCKDGPVFTTDQLGPSFGTYKRDKTGRLVPLR